MNKINIPKFYYLKKTLYIDKETYNRDVMKVKEYKEEELDKYKQVLIKIKKFTEVPINCDGQAEDILDKIIKTLEEIK